ncbi:ribonuclease H-like domain-containing protein [Trametes meyenii]|nr:ribonuclease H-like domain-containing protein [Trametes meyenii]
MAPIITFCNTPADLALATTYLSSQSIIILDCEARNLGMPGGALSLLSLSDVTASQVFLIDVLTFPATLSASGPTPPDVLRPLLALLSKPSITKLVWDGRGDVLELRLTYGVALEGVLDLQLVEVTARRRAARNRGDTGPGPDLVKGFFSPLQTEMAQNPAEYEGIYKLRGLNHVVGLFRLGGKQGAVLKDPEVVAMHQNNESELWMTRPLPAKLLAYAAHDLEMIALVYGHFMDKAWIRNETAQLKVQSARYVEMFRTREDFEQFSSRDLKRFMPFGFVEGGSRAPRYLCSSCEQSLTADCFTKKVTPRSQGMGGEVQRLSYCRLCNAIARRNQWAQGEWVDF